MYALPDWFLSLILILYSGEILYFWVIYSSEIIFCVKNLGNI
jgi:hypothetical protein